MEIRSKASIVGQKNYTYHEFILIILDNIKSASASVLMQPRLISLLISITPCLSNWEQDSRDDAVPINLTDLLRNKDFKNDLNSSFSQPESLEWNYCVTNEKFVLYAANKHISRGGR